MLCINTQLFKYLRKKLFPPNYILGTYFINSFNISLNAENGILIIFLATHIFSLSLPTWTRKVEL